ncbi:MAG: hypothetical protein JWN78_2705 [Bacteroidota bacterium]|nr:hypothetical protein [Bacteroidota bacterium]
MLKKIQQLSADIFLRKEQPRPHEILWHYLFGVVVILLCGLRVYHGLENVMDIQFADESAYMRFGLDLFGKLNRDWGPMYCLWYKFLSLFTTDTIPLYYLNYALTSILIGMLLYVFLLRISVHPVLALLISFSVLISELNVSVWPRISHFCIVLCLLFLIIITFIRNNIYKFSVFALMCLINSYARPEFYVSFLLAMIASLICIFYNRKTLSKKDFLFFAVIIVVIAVLHYIFRFPSNNFFGYNRGVAAFYQHYAFNYKLRTHANIDSWLYWEEISKKQFGDCNSVWCVIKMQPMIVLSNTLFNIKNYLISIIVHGYSYIFPIQLFHSKKVQIVIYILLTLIFLVRLIRQNSRQNFLNQLYEYRQYLLILFIFTAPTILSCVFVFPRDHYVYLQILFVLLLLISLFNPAFERISFKPVVFILFGGLIVLSTPNIKSYPLLKMNNDTNALCNKALVKYLRNYPGQHTLFTNMPFVRGMLPLNFHEVNTIFDKKKNIPFSHYMDSAKIDIVILTPSTFRDPHIAFDSTWNDFIANYGSYRFRKQPIANCEMYLLIKNEK